QHEAALALGVHRLAGDPARHPPNELGPRRQKSIVRTAVGLVVAGGLALADRQRAAVGAWSLEHPERDRIDMGDRQGARAVDRGSKLRCRLEAAEEVRLLEDHARRLA